ncbi:MAG: hypothetical protein KDA25_03250 [Phycisphaerales bacterium]|nr:hypothetical protein [Phycisphaerales bacterium]
MAGGPVIPQPKAGEPLHGLTKSQLASFLEGRVSYMRNLEVEEGLGPVFNQTSCGVCHANPVGGSGSQTVTRFGLLSKGGFDPLEQFGGSLLQAQAINDDCAEVIPDEATTTTLRVTNGVLGYGLIESIADEDIQFLADNQPAGLNGQTHMVEAFEDPKGSPLRVGRFGWKAQVATVLTFSADAALNEMGLTNRFLMTESDPNGINPPSLAKCDTVADPEDGPDKNGLDFIDRVTNFQRFLSGPPQTPRSGMTGEVIFAQIGCADCHTPSFVTSDDPMLEDVLRNRVIQPYSDFLLHDMGLLGDSIEQGAASGNQLRTPALWGIRLRDPMIHDGRFSAGTFETRVTDAIESHGPFGEGAASAAAFASLSAGEKSSLIQFLDSLGRAEFDHDGDNDVDLTDFISFAACFGGTGYTPDDPCAISDIDQDGDVDADDFASFMLVYTGPRRDCNCNGVTDIVDIINGDADDANGDGVPDSCIAFCDGDLDCTSEVGAGDLAVLLAAWGTCPDSGPCPADINGDGVVDPADLAALLSNWGPCK